MLVEVDVGEAGLLSRVTPDAVQRLGIAQGAAVLALVKSVTVELVAHAGEGFSQPATKRISLP